MPSAAPETPPVKALTAGERRRLGELEAVIDAGREAYAATADALFEIRERRLHRPKTFSAYVLERWPKSRQWIYDLLAWREVRESTGEDDLSQKAARVLKPLPVPVRRKVVTAARKRHPTGELSARKLRQARGHVARPISGKPCRDVRLHFGRFQQASVEPGSAALVLTDPPYGREWLPQWTELGEWAAAALRPGGFLIAYGPQALAPEIIEALGRSLEFAWLFARPIRFGVGCFAQRLRAGTCWTPLYVYQKPPAGPVGMGDLIPASPPETDFHPWQKPVAEFTHVLERMTQPGDLVLDPCAGSGTVGEACRRLGRRFVGWESDADTYASAARRLGVGPALAG